MIQYILSIGALLLGLAFLVFHEKLSFSFEKEIFKSHTVAAYRVAGVLLIVASKLISYGYIGIRY